MNPISLWLARLLSPLELVLHALASGMVLQGAGQISPADFPGWRLKPLAQEG